VDKRWLHEWLGLAKNKFDSFLKVWVARWISNNIILNEDFTTQTTALRFPNGSEFICLHQNFQAKN
jgi:hypothetical protein